MSILLFQSVSKNYSNLSTALQDVSFSIGDGEFVALAGPSGSGKTTILNLASGLDRPSSGNIFLLGNDTARLSEAELSALRRDCVGFVFQAFNLFPVLNTLENVEYPLALKGIPPRERHKRAVKALEEVGLKDFLRRFPAQLSGGQQQRVAIARAIVSEPKIIFADEPTANLDSKTAQRLIELFLLLNESLKVTFLFSSHDPMVLKSARRIVEVCDGTIRSDHLNDASNRTVVISDAMRPLITKSQGAQKKSEVA